MADTLRLVAGVVQSHCTLAPYLLARQWCIDAYRKAAQSRPWSFLVATTDLLTNASRTGTVTVTRGSLVVTGVGLTFTQADKFRQLRLATGPYPYTIVAVDLATNTATLDRQVANATGSYTATVQDCYATLPEDFGRFLGILDPSEGYQLRHWIQQEELNTYDPLRENTGTTTALSFVKVSEIRGIEGRNIFEWHPWPTAAKYYPTAYLKDVGSIGDDDSFRGPLRNRSDIIRVGALADAALWPGDGVQRNTFFNATVAERYRTRFEAELARLEVVDEDVNPTWFEAISWLGRPYFPVDDRFAQSHDVPLMAEHYLQ